MKKIYLFVLLLLLSCHPTTIEPTPESNTIRITQVEEVKYTINWRSYKEAVEESKKTQQPLFLFVSSKRCGICSEMKKSVLNDFYVKRLLSKEYISVLVDDSKDEIEFFNFLEEHNLNKVPTMIIQTPTGRSLVKTSGGINILQLQHFLKLGLVANKSFEIKKMDEAINSLIKTLTGN